MKLFYSPTSPFVRKIEVFAIENNLTAQIEKIQISTSAVAQDKQLGTANPIGKIPTLILDDDSVLYDSRVICQYLDTQHDNASFYSVDGADKWQILRLEALCDGISDAAVAAQYEKALRPNEKVWADWVEAQLGKVHAGIGALEKDVALLTNTPINVTHIAAACALGYVDFRHKSEDWRSKNPNIAAWLTEFNKRPSMQQTKPE